MKLQKLNPKELQYISHYLSPLGSITLAATSDALTGLWFDGQKYDRATLLETCLDKDLPIFTRVKTWLDAYFNGKNPIIDFPIALYGTDFRFKVWQILSTIPYGELITYKQITMQLGKANMSSQAVGGAVGHNPISIIIPCHRVVGTNGSLTGYAGGIDKKIALLKLEKANIDELFNPITKEKV